MDKTMERRPEDWRVGFRSGFFSVPKEKEAGQELALNREFCWAGHRWRIPAVYLCREGLVLDLCMQQDPDPVGQFLDRWRPRLQQEPEYFPQLQQQMEWENPLGISPAGRLVWDGQDLPCAGRSGVYYYSMVSAEEANPRARRVVDHYRLDPAFCWGLHRLRFGWGEEIGFPAALPARLELCLEEPLVPVPGPCFVASRPGDSLSFVHPVTGQPGLLKVQWLRRQQLDSPCRDGLCYPSQALAMGYTLSPNPEAEELTVEDTAPSDAPRRPDGTPEPGAWSMFLPIAPDAAERTVCSSLHFEPVDRVQWQLVFHCRRFAPAVVPLVFSGH